MTMCRMLKGGRTDVHDKERSGRPSVVSDDLVRSVDETMCERLHFTISELREFPQIARIVLYEIITFRLGYHHKLFRRWVPENAHGLRTKRREWLRL
jgi:hypothetical protein